MVLQQLKNLIKQHLSGKLQQDVLWNVGSFGIMGVSGIALNILIGLFYDAATLGVFNQVFAAYILFSQFGVAGVHLSTLKYVAEFSSDRKKVGAAIIAALGLAVALSLIASICFWFVRPAVGHILDSPGVATGMAWATPGLFCFAINKVLLGVLNGLRRMKLYAVLQASRPLLIVGALLVATMLSCPSWHLPLVFSVGESVLLVMLLLATGRHFCRVPLASLKEWTARHLDFGLRSVASGVLMELNTRVDVLMLGYFASDRIVGIYSFAAMLAEGVFQLPIVFRTNVNPILVRLIADRQFTELKAFTRKGKWVTYAVMIVVGGLAVALYPWGVALVSNKPDFHHGWPLFAILMGGIVVSAGYIPFGQILLQAGRPGLHTGMITMLVLFNAAANLSLIPIWGAAGAAFATALAFVLSAVLIAVLTRRTLGVTI